MKIKKMKKKKTTKEKWEDKMKEKEKIPWEGEFR